MKVVGKWFLIIYVSAFLLFSLYMLAQMVDMQFEIPRRVEVGQRVELTSYIKETYSVHTYLHVVTLLGHHVSVEGSVGAYDLPYSQVESVKKAQLEEIRPLIVPLECAIRRARLIERPR